MRDEGEAFVEFFELTGFGQGLGCIFFGEIARGLSADRLQEIEILPG